MKTEILDIETHNSDWQKIDYRPFTEGVVRRGFGGDIFDIESGFIRMATETGRFTSARPLFEAFKRWSPYSYSFVCPLALFNRKSILNKAFFKIILRYLLRLNYI